MNVSPSSVSTSIPDFIPIDDLKQIIQDVLGQAKKMGASNAIAEVSEGKGLSVTCCQQALETIEQTQDRSLAITVYLSDRRGSASTSDFTASAIRSTVEAAYNIAKYTAADPFAGLPEPQELVLEEQIADLELYHPWAMDEKKAVEWALRQEQGAQAVHKRLKIEDTSVNTFVGQFVLGNTHGFLQGYPFSQHSTSLSVIAGQKEQMQRDYWYTSHRNPNALLDPAVVGQKAGERALKRLGARRLPTGQYPVIFEAPLACGLLGHLTQALSGGALYRKTSFLENSLGQQIFPDDIDVEENPFIPQASGSSVFDDEGVRTQQRAIIDAGVVQGYFLSSYSARKLGMKNTGNAGGSHNLALRKRQGVEPDLAALLQKMGTGLLVTELIGSGVNYVTGDYSRGAFGYWVENGIIQYPVQEITIASTLQAMFSGIVGLANDTITRGNKTSGSVLFENMSIAGTVGE